MLSQPSGSQSNTGAFTGLPSWAVALPLWAGARWLWIAPMAAGEVRYYCGGSAGLHRSSRAPAMEQLPLATAYSVVVLDHRSATPQPSWWRLLASGLEPGGVLFVCGARTAGLPARIRSAAPALRPSEWHVIERSQDADWRLRPATGAALKLFDTALQPPLSLGARLDEIGRRWTQGGRLPCLPVWRDGEAQ